MIDEKTSDYNVQSTVQGDKIAMGIHKDAMAHIMGVLTDLYSDPLLAILREYSTNALDSHIEARVSRPIEVTTPSALSPFFTVQDFGVGLSHDDIRAIYSQYGASTKRDTNEQVGMLGLGCKSALSYTNQFTLVGVKNGVRVTVAIGRDEDGAGSMTVVDTSSTHDPNGVTVRVPAKMSDAYAFERKAQEFFRFWKAGTVLVNGEQPNHVEGLKVSDDFDIIDGHTDYIVMGNVAYPVTRGKINHGMGWGQSVVARVPIGSVNFTPSREALHYTPKTEATLRKVSADFGFHVKGLMQRIIDEQPDKPSALGVLVRWGQKLPLAAKSAAYTFEGKPMPREVRHAAMTITNRQGKLGNYSTQGAIQAEAFPTSIFVGGYDRATFTAGQKKKLMKHADDAGIQVRHWCLLTDKLTADERSWIEDDRIVAWPTIAAIKLPKASKTATWRLSGSFDCYVAGDPKHEVPAADVYGTDDDALYFYRGNLRDGRPYSAALSQIDPDATLVCLPANREAKFCRELPHAQNIAKIVSDQWAKFVKGVPADQKLAWTVQHDRSHADDLKLLDAEQINDPAIKRAIRAAKLDLTSLRAKVEAWGYLANERDLHVAYESPLQAYPLFSMPYRGYYGNSRLTESAQKQITHNVLYLNTVYAVESAKSAS